MVSSGKKWQRVEKESLSTEGLHEGNVGDDGIVLNPDFGGVYMNPYVCTQTR